MVVCGSQWNHQSSGLQPHLTAAVTLSTCKQNLTLEQKSIYVKYPSETGYAESFWNNCNSEQAKELAGECS